MKSIIERILKDRTCSMFSQEWYDNISEEINNKVFSNDDGYVYIIRSIDTNQVKIGISTNPQKRISNIVDYVGKVRVLTVSKSNVFKSLEKELHLRFKENRIRGEWFCLTDSDILDVCKEYSFTFIDKIFNNSTNILSYKFQTEKVYSSYIPDDVIDYLSSIDFVVNVRYDKNILFENFDNPNKIYQRKLTSHIRSFLKLKGLNFKEGKSNNMRYFEIY